MNMSTRVDPKEFATIEYSFVAPAAGTYAFTLDMETRDNVDHNDVYAQFVQGGWHLERFDAERDRTGLIKVYHNDEGRVIKAFSVDKNRHSISTKRELVQGDTYNIRIGGRSTMTTLHAIVMFPCQGRGCRLGDFWNGRVSECAP